MPGNNTRIFEKQTPGLSGHMHPEHTTAFRESSFNMTRGGDEDIETQSLKF